MGITKIHYELRTSKVTVAVFETPEQARKWLQPWTEKQPEYAKSLKLYKITTKTTMEAT